VDSQNDIDLTKIAGVAALAFTCLKRHNQNSGPGRWAKMLLRWKPLAMNGGFLLAITMRPEDSESISCATIGSNLDEGQVRIWRSEAIAMIQSIGCQKRSNFKGSWESRDPDNHLWGGAIVTSQGWYVACRGTGQESYDEAMALVIGVLMGWIDLYYAREIGRMSGNPDFGPLCLETIKSVIDPASTR
jgi:hypothetical protein